MIVKCLFPWDCFGYGYACIEKENNARHYYTFISIIVMSHCICIWLNWFSYTSICFGAYNTLPSLSQVHCLKWLKKVNVSLSFHFNYIDCKNYFGQSNRIN